MPTCLSLSDFATEAPSHIVLVSDINATCPANPILNLITLNSIMESELLRLQWHYWVIIIVIINIINKFRGGGVLYIQLGFTDED
jgi:hypothetical protein